MRRGINETIEFRRNGERYAALRKDGDTIIAASVIRFQGASPPRMYAMRPVRIDMSQMDMLEMTGFCMTGTPEDSVYGHEIGCFYVPGSESITREEYEAAKVRFTWAVDYYTLLDNPDERSESMARLEELSNIIRYDAREKSASKQGH